MNENKFNGYSFTEKEMRRRMKYVIITNGDLDSNGAYAFSSHKALRKYIKETKYGREIQAIFKIKDVTKFYSK